MKKTVLITGGSRGIGAAAVERFAKGGYRVLFCYHSAKPAADALVQSMQTQGYEVSALRADVARRADVLALTEAASRWGGIDVLINNAGVAQQKLFTELSTEEWRQMFEVNVNGVFHCCQAVLPQMIRKQQGCIINLSSVWGITGASCEVAYSASKAAIIGLTKALAKELGPSGIRVNCVAPGVIDTDMNSGLTQADLHALKEQTALQTIGTPADIAHTLFFLASPEAAFITGQVLSPNGGFVI